LLSYGDWLEPVMKLKMELLSLTLAAAYFLASLMEAKSVISTRNFDRLIRWWPSD